MRICILLSNRVLYSIIGVSFYALLLYRRLFMRSQIFFSFPPSLKLVKKILGDLARRTPVLHNNAFAFGCQVRLLKTTAWTTICILIYNNTRMRVCFIDVN